MKSAVAEGRDPRRGPARVAAGFTPAAQACPLSLAGGTAAGSQGPVASGAVVPGTVAVAGRVSRSWVQPTQAVQLGTLRGRTEHENASLKKLIVWQHRC